MVDVFVIGGGPAGLAAAIAARRRGMKVVLADGNRPPVDKPCGEGLMPDSRATAARLGISLPRSLGFEFRGIRFHGDGKHGMARSVQADFPAGRGMGVRRTALHSLLIEAAEREGVALRWNCPVSDLDGGLEKVAARWIIGADGSTSRVRRLAGLDSCRWNSRRYARRMHYAISPWTDYVEVYWGDGCQIYVTPVSADEICLALISRSPELRLGDALRRHFPGLCERLRGVPPSSRERGAITATVRLRSVAQGNVALIGDASGSVDAITGEGICLGFKQAEALAAAMCAGNLAGYNRIHPRLSLRPHAMAQAMLMMDRADSVRRAAMSALSFQPWIFRQLLALHVWQ
jgi:2-polyprenyl-6-methoxyphenol hydroxylase-like FAD-dependent oxidoreductase